MRRKLAWALTLAGTAVLLLSGCLVRRETARPAPLVADDFSRVALEVEYPDVEPAASDQVGGPGNPRSIEDHDKLKYRNITLQEAIQLALEHSQVMTDLGGTVLRAPDTMRTTYNPAIQETDPQFGVEGALSVFDAQFATSLLFEKNDRRYNNRFVGNLGFFDQEFNVFKAEVTKRAVTGSQFTARKIIDFDRNNNLGNQFRQGAWDALVEGEVRHPFLRGGGVEFNRIAGTSGEHGVYNGVLIARVRTDITLADFQAGVRDLLANVENAYWDLYFAYRDLDTKIRARDSALETWRRIHALYKTGRRGGEAEKEAQAREQYYRFESELQNALSGHPLEGTRTNNGTTPGTFRAVPGVYLAERRLRLIMGLPPNDDFLFRPADEPPVARVRFDWPVIIDEALAEREEIRRQRWEVKRRELELIASKNSLLPSLDFVGRYRWRGFGETLLDPERDGRSQFDNAMMDLTSGKFQEWQMGMEFSMPFGFRQGHAAVRNAELRLAHARAVLREQELQIAHDLSTAVTELDRAYWLLQTETNRAIAAHEQLAALTTAYENDKAEFFVVLDAQRRAADAEIRYHQARIEYIVALRNVHFEKGSLLAYCGVQLAEGPWPVKAYIDAQRLEKRRYRGELRTDYRLNPPGRLTVDEASEPDGTTPIEHADEVHAPVSQPQAGHESAPQRGEEVSRALGFVSQRQVLRDSSSESENGLRGKAAETTVSSEPVHGPFALAPASLEQPPAVAEPDMVDRFFRQIGFWSSQSPALQQPEGATLSERRPAPAGPDEPPAMFPADH